MAKRSNVAKAPIATTTPPAQKSVSMGAAAAPTKLPERESTPAQSKSSPRGMTNITHEMIANRAYEIWKAQGGSDMENWLRAESELRSATTASM